MECGVLRKKFKSRAGDMFLVDDFTLLSPYGEKEQEEKLSERSVEES